jgi:fumigaclavine B O-acetyltransferase
MLSFSSADPKIAVQTVRKGIKKLLNDMPWLAGDVITHTDPETRGFIHPPKLPLNEIEILSVKHFEHDEDFQSHPTSKYLPVPVFIPATKQRPVIRLQANVFPTKVLVAFSWMHQAFDGSGAGTVLESLSECCRAAAGESVDMSITETIAATAVAQRREVSTWASKAQIRVSHDIGLGPPAFNSNISSEQWGAMESAMGAATSTHRLTFCPSKVAALKASCTSLLSQIADTSVSSFFSSSDIVAAVLSISIDRAMHAEPADPANPRWTFTAADLRHGVNPPLPDTYLGNMIYAAWKPIDCGQIRDLRNQDNDADLLHVTQLASQVRIRIGQLNEVTAYSCSARVAETGNWYETEGKAPNVVFTSWRHLKCYALDFGPGLEYIDDFEPGFALIPGACIMLPRRTSEAEPDATVPWELSVTLMVGQYETLVRDRLLMQILADE